MFTKVKGIGNRKALRAMRLPTGDIAKAISERNIEVLTSLPEIGRRTAEAIIVELHGKTDDHAPQSGDSSLTMTELKADGIVGEAVSVLVQLGEMKSIATELVQRAQTADKTIDTPDALVTAAFRLKST